MPPDMNKLWTTVNACVHPDEQEHVICTVPGVRASGRSFAQFRDLLDGGYREFVVLLPNRVLYVSPPDHPGLFAAVRATRAMKRTGSMEAAVSHQDWARASVQGLTTDRIIPFGWRLVGATWLRFQASETRQEFVFWIDEPHLTYPDRIAIYAAGQA